jgi:hypothetical protein
MEYTTTTIQGKEVTVSDRDKKYWEKNTTQAQRNDPGFITDFGDNLKKKTGTLGSPKPEPTPEPTPEPKSLQDKPGTRYSTRVAGEGSVVAPSSPDMTAEALARRAAGNWNKPTSETLARRAAEQSGKPQPKRDKVGNKQVRGRSIVTHNCETGITTVDPSGTKGGSKKIVTMPTSEYFDNPKYVRGAKKD